MKSIHSWKVNKDTFRPWIPAKRRSWSFRRRKGFPRRTRKILATNRQVRPRKTWSGLRSFLWSPNFRRGTRIHSTRPPAILRSWTEMVSSCGKRGWFQEWQETRSVWRRRSSPVGCLCSDWQSVLSCGWHFVSAWSSSVLVLRHSIFSGESGVRWSRRGQMSTLELLGDLFSMRFSSYPLKSRKPAKRIPVFLFQRTLY